MSAPEDLTRQLLAPRGRGRPAEAEPTLPEPPRRPGWRVGALLTLSAAAIAAAVMVGQWLKPSTGSTETASRSIKQQTAPRSVEPIVRSPAENPRVGATQALAKAAAPMADLSELLQGPPSTRLRWARFKPNPAIVVIEYPNLHEQGLAMNRLAAMFEKRTARPDRVPTDAEVADLIRRSGDSVASFYQGHDYPAAKVARFFSLAEAQRMTLSPQEIQLRQLMLETGLMTRGAAYSFRPAGNQAVVSFTGVQPDDPATTADEQVDSVRREAVLRHELSHGEFFTNLAYRAHCMKFWRQMLSESERRLFSTYLRSLDYNPGDEELMANETQALLMHTPDRRAFNANGLGLSEASLEQLRSRFRSGERGARPKG